MVFVNSHVHGISNHLSNVEIDHVLESPYSEIGVWKKYSEEKCHLSINNPLSNLPYYAHQ